MSESIHSGYLPLWNPYINFGLPQYADMSSGYWSPITWLIASTVGYNAYTFTQEILLYILIGGIGMYKLTGYWNLQSKIKLLAGVAYMCCGYNVGHLQHFNWLSGAAFLPWCMWAYLQLYKNASVKNFLQAGLLFYLFISSAHPGLVIGALYFFIAVALFLFVSNERKLSFAKNLRLAGSKNILLLAILALLSTGLIIGYFDILPYFSRGQKLYLHDSLQNPTSFQSWLSFVMPFSITRNDSFFATDISMRNVYMGLTMAMFFFLSLVQQKDRWQKFLLGTGGLFLLLSSGGIFKTIAYKIIPLIGYVRLDGEFTLFTLFCFILVAAIQLDKCSAAKMNFRGQIVWVYYFFEIIIGVLVLLGIFGSRTHQSFIYHVHEIISKATIQEKLKTCIDAITFYDTLWLQGLIQLFILWGIKRCLRKADYKMMVLISIVDLCVATLLNLPFTGVGKSPVSQVQAVLNRSPHGIVIPAMKPVYMIDTLNMADKGLVGDWSMYNKQLGTTSLVSYPILLKNTLKYFDTIQTDTSASCMNKNFIFTTASQHLNNGYDGMDSPRIILFSPNRVKLSVKASGPGTVVYQQNLYPHWFYNDGHGEKKVLPYGITFFSAPLMSGQNNIEFSFKPAKVIAGMFVTCSVLVIIVLMLVIFYVTKIGRDKQLSR